MNSTLKRGYGLSSDGPKLGGWGHQDPLIKSGSGKKKWCPSQCEEKPVFMPHDGADAEL